MQCLEGVHCVVPTILVTHVHAIDRARRNNPRGANLTGNRLGTCTSRCGEEVLTKELCYSYLTVGGRIFGDIPKISRVY